jgi:hypothetical protein
MLRFMILVVFTTALGGEEAPPPKNKQPARDVPFKTEKADEFALPKFDVDWQRTAKPLSDVSKWNPKIKARKQREDKALKAVLKIMRSKLQRCYMAAARKDPSLSGRVNLAFSVEPSGILKVTSKKNGDKGSDRLAKCIVKALNGMILKDLQGPKDAPTIQFSLGFGGAR